VAAARFVAIGWAIVLTGIGIAGGTRTLGAVLGAAYLVQVAPAVWTVLREPVPSGVATSTWLTMRRPVMGIAPIQPRSS